MPDINIGQLSEAINNKMDRDGHNIENPSAVIIETYSNETEWYRVWSDGWCEQGGRIGGDGWKQHAQTITYLKPLNTDMPLYINICASSGVWTGRDTATRYGNTTTTMTSTGFWLDCNQYSDYVYWKAEGYIL